MREEFAALLFFFGISLTANIALAVAWFRANRRLRRLEDRLLPPLPVTDDRMVERLESAIDGLNAQMDQLASGQEFLNRVMAERLERSLARPSEPERETTPH